MSSRNEKQSRTGTLEVPVESECTDECEYLTPNEFVRHRGLSLSTVRRYLAQGHLPKIQPAGPRGKVLIPREALNVVQPKASMPRDTAPINTPVSLETASESSPKHTP